MPTTFRRPSEMSSLIVTAAALGFVGQGKQIWRTQVLMNNAGHRASQDLAQLGIQRCNRVDSA